MKVAVTAEGTGLDSKVDPRFGRCPYFLFVETETMDFEAVENSNLSLGGGAGIQAAQFVAERGAKAVLTGNCGPNAYQTLTAAGVQVVVGVNGLVKEAVERFKSGGLRATSGPNVEGHFGTGGLPHSGRPGGGFGRGMGRGYRMGLGRSHPVLREGGVPNQLSREDELRMLREEARAIEEEKNRLEERIRQLEVGTGTRAIAIIDQEKCSGCGICIPVCPTQAIQMEGEKAVVKDGCTACARCVGVCPTGAISIG